MLPIFGGLANIHAASQAVSAQNSARRSEAKASKVEWNVREMTDRIDKLSLICSAMWQLVKEKTDLTEEDLMRRVQELDLADGVADGKVTKKIKRCSSCDRVMNPRHEHCLYCGQIMVSSDIFDQVT